MPIMTDKDFARQTLKWALQYVENMQECMYLAAGENERAEARALERDLRATLQMFDNGEDPTKEISAELSDTLARVHSRLEDALGEIENLQNEGD